MTVEFISKPRDWNNRKKILSPLSGIPPTIKLLIRWRDKNKKAIASPFIFNFLYFIFYFYGIYFLYSFSSSSFLLFSGIFVKALRTKNSQTSIITTQSKNQNLDDKNGTNS